MATRLNSIFYAICHPLKTLEARSIVKDLNEIQRVGEQQFEENRRRIEASEEPNDDSLKNTMVL